MEVSSGPPPLPRNIAELTAERLSALLAYRYPGTEVNSLHFGTVLHGTATKVRLLLNYNEAGHSHRLPATMYAKCGFEVHSQNRHMVESARSEVVFYLRRAPEGLVNVPKCYFGGQDKTTGTSFLLLEDLLARNVTMGSALHPIEPQIVRLGLEMLARYHARWWNSPELEGLGSPIVADDWVGFILDQGNFERSLHLPRFEYVPPEMRSRERIRSALYRLWESNTQGPCCILHGDLHLGNCYFDVDGTPGLLDWQGDTRGCWAHDFTEFLLTTLEVDARRNHERPLLEFYLQQLGSHGVDAPSFENAWQQYRRNTLWVAYSSAVCPVAMQPEAVLTAYTRRGMAAATDLDALASFES